MNQNDNSGKNVQQLSNKGREQELLKEVEQLRQQVEDLKIELCELDNTKHLDEYMISDISPQEVLNIIAADDKVYQDGLRRVTLESLKATDDMQVGLVLLSVSSVSLSGREEQISKEQQLLESTQPDYAYHVTPQSSAEILGQNLEAIWASKAEQSTYSGKETTQERWKKGFVYIMKNIAIRRHFIGLVREMSSFQTEVTKYWYVWYSDEGDTILYQMYLIPCIFDDGVVLKRACLLLTHVRPDPVEKQARFLRDFMGLRYSPSMMTLVSKSGHVLSQNAASCAYLGILAENIYESFDGCVVCQKLEQRHFIKELFGYDEELYNEMVSETENGTCWRKKVMIPQSMQPDGYKDTWHFVQISKMRDPITSEDAYVVAQQDITLNTKQQQQINNMIKQERSLLREMLPQHVIDKLLYKVKGVAMSDVTDSRGNIMRSSSSSSDLDLGLMTALDVQELSTSHPQVTVLFSDIKGFTSMSQTLPPAQVMQFLNKLYSRWDEMLEQFGVYKIETIGDAYIVAAGLMTTIEEPDGTIKYQVGKVDPRHAHRAVSFGRAMLETAQELQTPNGEAVQVRIGIHTGPVVSGVVGTKMPRFCLFGETVNFANKMESSGVPGKIHASQQTRILLKDLQWEATNGVEVNGRSKIQTYLLNCKKETVEQLTQCSNRMDSRDIMQALASGEIKIDL